jgi:glycosyltransferase involved in cell wall biosynthesis
MSRYTLVVAVLTYKRPRELGLGLPLILQHVAELNAGGDIAARIVVIDNDPEASARGALEQLDSELLSYVLEPVPGISAGRNRALDEASADDLLVFIDDDERPRAQWLVPLVETWQKTQAAAVMGRVVSEFEAGVDPWIQAGRFFVRRRMPTGSPVEVAAAGNLLLDMRQISQSGVRFHLDFGLTGAEDTLFSRMLRQAGSQIVWCDESATTDFVPASRTTRRWVLMRSWSHGNSLALVDLHLADGLKRQLLVRLRFLARGMLRVGGGSGRYLLGVLSRSQQHEARGLRAVLRGAGMIAGAAGFAYLEYGRSESAAARILRQFSLTPKRTGANP